MTCSRASSSSMLSRGILAVQLPATPGLLQGNGCEGSKLKSSDVSSWEEFFK
jgi:hypothetical protein